MRERPGSVQMLEQLVAGVMSDAFSAELFAYDLRDADEDGGRNVVESQAGAALTVARYYLLQELGYVKIIGTYNNFQVSLTDKGRAIYETLCKDGFYDSVAGGQQTGSGPNEQTGGDSEGGSPPPPTDDDLPF